MRFNSILFLLLFVVKGYSQKTTATLWQKEFKKSPVLGMLFDVGAPLLPTEFIVNNSWDRVFQNGIEFGGNERFTSTRIRAVRSLYLFNNLL
jgi:hypothetical protein